MILYSYTWSFNFSCPNIISKKLRLIHKKKKVSNPVHGNKRKRGSKSRSKGARWTPCLPPGPFLPLSVLPPSDASPSRIKYPWKDGLLFSIVLNNRHNQQIRQVHHIDSNINIKKLCGSAQQTRWSCTFREAKILAWHTLFL